MIYHAVILKACYKTCYQRYLIERCGCGDAQYPLKGTAFGGDAAYHSCSSTNVTEGVFFRADNALSLP